MTQSPVKNFFGIDNLDNILPEYVKNSETRNPQVITIEGGSGLYKSDIAINALLHGMTQGENGMIIRLNDRDLFKDDGVRLSQSVFDELKDKNGKIIFIPDDESEPHQVSGYKIKSSLWKYKEQKLVEIVFKSGALLPEEFVDVVCRKINQHNIKRIAFIDLKNIGVSYPFLINSETSGSMFIPAFIHLMRNYRVHLIMSSSSSDLEESDREVRKASGLSDIIIKLTQDNKKNIIISCIGNIGSRSEYEIEKKPYSAACIYFKNDTDQNLINHTPKLDFFEVTEKKK